jgi:hypothetical protein
VVITTFPSTDYWKPLRHNLLFKLAVVLSIEVFKFFFVIFIHNIFELFESFQILHLFLCLIEILGEERKSSTPFGHTHVKERSLVVRAGRVHHNSGTLAQALRHH